MVFKRTEFIQSRGIKSRRDGILLTVGFNLRMTETERSSRSPALDDTLSSHCVVPAGLLDERVMLASP